MSRATILGKPIWREFLQRKELSAIPLDDLIATDDFFAFVASYGLATPTEADLLRWSRARADFEPAESLAALSRAMVLLYPTFAKSVETALLTIRTVGTTSESARTSGDAHKGNSVEPPDWDPCAKLDGNAPIARHVSVDPWTLPDEVKQALRKMASGLPGQDAQAPARSILVRMRDKLCQFAFVLAQHDRPFALTPEHVDLFQEELTRRCKNSKNGFRWATLRASMEELYRFARYTGAQASVIDDLSKRHAWLEGKEQLQTSLKLTRLAASGHTTDSILDLAEETLAGASSEPNRTKRHRKRNGACILAIIANLPLRNASAHLVFGENLFWENNEYVVRMKIQKTHTRRPVPFVGPLDPEYGRFIDAVLLGDLPEECLPELRAEAITSKRALFVSDKGVAYKPSYVPRRFKELTGVSLTSARAMNHTDAAKHHGPIGAELAKAACNQTSDAVVNQHYFQEAAAAHLSSQLMSRRNARRKSMAQAT
ncbi:hypothetical protein GQE99_16250 [Maritimibacter sp. DP07]|uniref:Uncharacterized protein n=1 Tax=Maritimibacter harenae TaxID=2606218 RepID=A0A845M5S9_9RHOB|nr:hypothetical protein [Maritimibacter harenae]MZR14572.1 hypothetical protein [Maritimibacter harenae]